MRNKSFGSKVECTSKCCWNTRAMIVLAPSLTKKAEDPMIDDSKTCTNRGSRENDAVIANP